MKFEIWGSGGGEGYPALFCNCENCRLAREEGGKSIRTLSQSCIDRKLLIDLPADTHMHLIDNCCSLGDISNILITHTHADHYCPNILELRGSFFAQGIKDKILNIYGNPDVKRLFDGVFSYFPISDEIRGNINFIVPSLFTPFKVEKYKVTALPAKHSPEQLCLNYIVDDGKSRLLYFLDTGFPEESIFEYLKSLNLKFDCVAMDSTMGLVSQFTTFHMCFDDNIALKNKLESMGITDEHTKFTAMHITHNHAPCHDKIVEFFNGTGIEPSFDGMVLEF